MTRPTQLGLAAAGLLVVLHVGLGLLPAAPFTPAMNGVLLATNLYVLTCAVATLRGRPGRHAAGFVVGYLALAGLVLHVLGKPPLFILLVVAYASVFGSPVLLGCFGLFVLCFVILQPYGFETFLPLALVYAALYKARRAAPRFVLVCLAGGLLALTAVLFPLIHMMLQDSAHTLWRAFARREVRDALLLSLATSTVATAIVAVWGIPLAYALARTPAFGGKRFIETLIDLPILVPQSVAGIALVQFLGPGSVLGHALQAAGIKVSGTFAAIVIAQVFVAAPFLVKSALTAFEAVPLQLELASRSLGRPPAATFLRISLPLAARGIAVGAALAWARAVSEFGTVILFAPTPPSGPVLVHTEFLRAGATESRPVAVVLLVVCVWTFVVLRFADRLAPFGLRRRGSRA